MSTPEGTSQAAPDLDPGSLESMVSIRSDWVKQGYLVSILVLRSASTRKHSRILSGWARLLFKVMRLSKLEEARSSSGKGSTCRMRLTNLFGSAEKSIGTELSSIHKIEDQTNVRVAS